MQATSQVSSVLPRHCQIDMLMSKVPVSAPLEVVGAVVVVGAKVVVGAGVVAAQRASNQPKLTSLAIVTLSGS